MATTTSSATSDLVRAMEAAFDTSDFTSLQSTLPVLGSAGVRALHQAAFEAACMRIELVL